MSCYVQHLVALYAERVADNLDLMACLIDGVLSTDPGQEVATLPERDPESLVGPWDTVITHRASSGD